jgi:DNA-binding MarR family transcriptional regulator
MEKSATLAGPYIGTLMRVCWQWIHEEVYRRLLSAGYTDLSPTHLSVFRFPTPDGVQPSRLAERLQITKQSVNDLLRDLEALGYLTREEVPSDGRARVIRLTPDGRRLEKVVHHELQLAEERIATILGSDRFSEYRQMTVEIVEALTGHRVTSTP